MNHDLQSLLASLLDGDLTAAVPLLDLLRERGDERRTPLYECVGTYLQRREDDATIHSQRIVRYANADTFGEFCRSVRLLFWLELDGAEKLRRFSGVPEQAAGQSGEHLPPLADIPYPPSSNFPVFGEASPVDVAGTNAYPPGGVMVGPAVDSPEELLAIARLRELYGDCRNLPAEGAE